ncbi:MAG: YIP1 family protein [Candidatus Diapherotrites archaeon]|nr:YIP1 family protein [Candidatus Diapherotrites archaeon]
MTFKVWIDAFIKPSETFAAEKANATAGKGSINFFIAGFMSALISYLIFALFPNQFFSIYGYQPSTLPLPLSDIAGISIVMPVATIVIGIIWTTVIFVASKILGGKGNFTALLYLVSLPLVVFSLISWIPYVGILVMLYLLWLEVIAVRESQELSTGKSIATILIPPIIVVVLVIIAIVLIGATSI